MNLAGVERCSSSRRAGAHDAPHGAMEAEAERVREQMETEIERVRRSFRAEIGPTARRATR
jgi:hypothetical protein